MKHNDLAKKVKELRTKKGYSQEELAEQAQLNLRTIQRIEAGKTEPRGDTLKRLALALDVAADELINWTEQEDNSFLVLLNLSGLTFIAFPLFGIFIPLALWIMRREKVRHVREVGRKLINFQITMCILGYGSLMAFFIMKITHTSFTIFEMLPSIPGFNLSGEFVLVLFIIFYAFNILVFIFNSIRSYHGKQVIYQPAIPFLR
ncbi:helix-turn-helix domain-containing protein [Pedobacter sp. GR22-6]|uniref:helix-turn-helix domain-containing protein n=1 Tax=Pedobacter sp. GR22-6 TaxID=3127957 RepID=UPI00307F1227